jgi:hypothetical protein
MRVRHPCHLQEAMVTDPTRTVKDFITALCIAF